MALISATKIWNDRNDIVAYEWVMTENDTAEAARVPNRSDKTIQVHDDFGTSGAIRVAGSIDPGKGVFADLTDPQGNTIEFTAAGIETIMENVAYIRPRISAGTSVSVTIRIFMTGQ